MAICCDRKCHYLRWVCLLKFQREANLHWYFLKGTARRAFPRNVYFSFVLSPCRETLVAPYCAIPRDYLSDNPPIARYGVFGVSTWSMGCDTPSPFSERLPLGEHARSRCDTPPPHKRGISSIFARYRMKQGKWVR